MSKHSEKIAVRDQPILEVEDLSYGIGSKNIIKNLSFSLKRGELLGLIGPNGAGKSTLLKTIIQYFKPTGGSVKLEGLDMEEMRAVERAKKVSYLSQEGPDSFAYSVLEVVLMGSYPHLNKGTHPGKLEEEEAIKMLQYLGMEHMKDRDYPSLSGGEKQLILFARVLLQNSDLLLLDEPTANLDLGHESTLLQILQELIDEGKTAIIALHNLNLAAEYCDKLLLLKDGEIVSQGTPDQVLKQKSLESVYDTGLEIQRDEQSARLTIFTQERFRKRNDYRIHIIGGAGSAINITRHLHRLGFTISGGIAHGLDSDARLWESLGLDFIQVQPFSAIDSKTLETAKELVEAAEVVILCPFPFGPGNEANLELLEVAKEIFVLQDEFLHSPREFFTEKSKRRYESILGSTPQWSYTKLAQHFSNLALQLRSPRDLDSTDPGAIMDKRE